MIGHNSWETLKKTLQRDLDPTTSHGRKIEFSRATGFSRATVDRWLNGQNIPGIDDLDKIAAWFGVPPWELLKPLDAGIDESIYEVFALWKRISPHDELKELGLSQLEGIAKLADQRSNLGSKGKKSVP